MKINDYAPITKTGKKRNVSSSSSSPDGDFMGLLSTEETESPSPVAAPADMQPVASMNLLSLQEMPEDEIKKRRALQESRGMLDALETLRLALLTGSVPEHLLHTLTRVVALQKSRVDDPHLMSIIEDIELRAAVELAKLERASAKN